MLTETERKGIARLDRIFDKDPPPTFEESIAEADQERNELLEIEALERLRARKKAYEEGGYSIG